MRERARERERERESSGYVQWIYPDRPWVGMELPFDEVDITLFATATHESYCQQWPDSKLLVAKFTSSMDGNTLDLLFPPLYKHGKGKNRTVAVKE